jgi:hypothetical protein
VARADGPGDPVPISPCLFGEFDVCAPALLGNANQNPITITDFTGFVGLAYISGMADEYDANSGRYIQTLPFLDSDMRFMQGTYIDSQGRTRQGTFALV